MACAIGIDIGGTNVRAARIATDGTVEDHVSERTDRDPDALLARILALAGRLLRPDVKAVGIGVPGRVDHARRRALSGGYVDLSRVDVARIVEERFGRPVAIDNDVAMALVAEHARGAARGRDNVVMLAIGTGIGGAVRSAGHVLHGRGNAGQLGHIVIERNGPACACGRHGCLEALAAGPALARLIAEAGLPGGMRAEELLASARAGDLAAAQVLRDWAAALRSGIDSLVAVLDPDLVVLGGGLGHVAAQALSDFGPPPAPWFGCPVAPAALGDAAGIVGCALAALQGAPARDLVP